MKPPAAAATLAEVRQKLKNERLKGMLNDRKTCMRTDQEKTVNLSVVTVTKEEHCCAARWTQIHTHAFVDLSKLRDKLLCEEKLFFCKTHFYDWQRKSVSAVQMKHKGRQMRDGGGKGEESWILWMRWMKVFSGLFFFHFWAVWQLDKTSQKSTCGRQCVICVKNALINAFHYLFLKSTPVGGEKYLHSCSHKDKIGK